MHSALGGKISMHNCRRGRRRGFSCQSRESEPRTDKGAEDIGSLGDITSRGLVHEAEAIQPEEQRGWKGMDCQHHELQGKGCSGRQGPAS